MKKILIILLGAALATVIYWLGFAIGAYFVSHETEVMIESNVMSDVEIMESIVMEDYGPGYYGVLSDNNDDEFIDYVVYSNDGTLQYMCSSHRSWYLMTLSK